MVMPSRPPLDTNGRPHQSHSLDPPGFLPPHPGQIAISSVIVGGDTAAMFYTSTVVVPNPYELMAARFHNITGQVRD